MRTTRKERDAAAAIQAAQEQELRRRRAAEASQRIADTVLRMQRLAKSHGLKTLQGLLEIAYQEAFSFANLVDIPEVDREYLTMLEAALNPPRKR